MDMMAFYPNSTKGSIISLHTTSVSRTSVGTSSKPRVLLEGMLNLNKLLLTLFQLLTPSIKSYGVILLIKHSRMLAYKCDLVYDSVSSVLLKISTNFKLILT